MGVRQSAPYLAVYGEIGLFPLHLRQEGHLVKSWLQILMLPGDHAMKIIFNDLAELSDTRHYNIAQKVKLVLSYYGFDINRLIGAAYRKIK